ncbi:substrate-binding domain-containing protein [Blastococcus saxobsidens]|uniref:Putative D-ribose-binding protein n=1 Tax=Blastococcus saxobsidens (strain DD2) TaxID=1146883 RepID=H6RWH5_BLASD|nr:substrate-binding domain-containing protein [Blastococcus saxobsidens]CCG03390.1 putative D-ribose-binding protein [Blastococcus saxobsidens DD2]
MNRPKFPAKPLTLLSVGVLTLAACGGGSDDTQAASGGAAANGDVPSWCGPDEIVLGMTDGFGGNSWRLITTASARAEAAKCPSVAEFQYADGQGDTQKAIADIQGMVATGVDALVSFPDAGEAMLPALRSAKNAGVVTVPYRVDPGGEPGEDYDAFIGSDFEEAGRLWGEWIKEVLPEGGNVLFLGGPPGNSQSLAEAEGLHEVLDPTGKYTFIGEQPFEVTNWDPAETQQVLTSAIAQNPEIDVIVSDFGPSLVGALPVFERSGRSIPAIATSDGNALACFWEENQEANPDFELFTVSTQNDHSRLAIQHAVARATGGEVPADDVYPSTAFENSLTGSPNPVTCEPELPGDIYLSAEMPAEEQADVIE